MLIKIIVRLTIIVLGIRHIFRLNIGDEVLWKGLTYTLVQGVYDPTWDLKRGELRYNHIYKDKFKKLVSFKNIIHDFKFAQDFYMGYWYDIWCRNPKEIRMY